MDIKQLIGKTTDYDKKIALERKNNQVFIHYLGRRFLYGISKGNIKRADNNTY